MRLVFAGTPLAALPSLERLAATHDVVAVLTRPATPQGRSGRPVASAVAQWAQTHGIEVLAPASPRAASLARRLTELSPDCCPVVAYGGLIPRALLCQPPHGWINLHFSLLPAWRGAAPVQRAILAGQTTTGVTTFQLVPELDAGPVYRCQPTEIGRDETAGDLTRRLADIGAAVLDETLRAVAEGERPRSQPVEGVSLAPKIDPAEARVDPNQPAADLLSRIRAMSPEPGAWASLAEVPLKILRARLAEAPSDPAPVSGPGQVGDLVATKRALYWIVRDGAIELVEVQAAGRRAMAGADWARGALRGPARLV